MKNITNLALSIVLLSSTVSSPVTVLADSVKTETVTNINKKNLGHVGTKASNSEGMWGTSSLTFTPSTGVLIIGAGEASGTLSEAMRITSGHSLQEVKTISFSGKVVAPVDSSMLFSGATQVTKCEIGENLDTSKVTNMSAMFFDVGSTNLDLSHFDTSKVTDMSGMFEYAKLTSLDLTGFDTSKVTDMSEMFKDTMSLTSLDLTGFDTSKVTNMNAMFFFAEGLTTLDLSHFDTSKVTDMHLIFACMISLERLDITGFDTLNVVMHGDADNAFGNDVNLEELKLGTKFKFKKTPTTDNMGLPEHEDINFVTEKWQNVGTGTIDKPNGSNEWTSAEFMANYDGLKDAGTYVWQPKAVQGADVTVKYVDEAGQSITKDV
ncbi:BspA family leucine-rich repeat surface protein, partial [Dellaglioa algida]